MYEKLVCVLSGMLGAAVTFCFGGWNDAMTTLLVFMAIDYISGICVAIAGKSTKTATGTLNSKVGWKGLMKKGCMMLILIVACRLDILLDTKWYVRDASCIAFILNELLSIIENYGEIGPVPPVIRNVIDVLKGKAGYEGKENSEREEKDHHENERKN
ncbi:MAG: phage holin family protein [Oscillospiraceae bacterium]|nr:phage holin family protein [Oscillospiraceae bacterium]